MKHTEDFKREAVKIALSSGLSRTRIAADFGMDSGLPSDRANIRASGKPGPRD